jgi:hypothetical protein
MKSLFWIGYITSLLNIPAAELLASPHRRGGILPSRHLAAARSKGHRGKMPPLHQREVRCIRRDAWFFAGPQRDIRAAGLRTRITG